MSACRRYSRLKSEALDRDLKPREARFMESHVDSCEECRGEEVAGEFAFDMLRSMAFEVETSDISAGFDERVIRRVQLETARNGVRYWSPAVLGAAVACIALFVALHVAATPARPLEVNPAASQVRNMEKSNFPRLELDRVPEFQR